MIQQYSTLLMSKNTQNNSYNVQIKSVTKYSKLQLHFTHFILYHWRRKWQPTPVFLPGDPHGQRTLAGHGPWGRRESDTTEVTEHAYTYNSLSHCCCLCMLISISTYRPGKHLSNHFSSMREQILSYQT